MKNQNGSTKNLKVVNVDIDNNILTFDNGMTLFSEHKQDCCEDHYISLSDIVIDDFDGLEFDLSNDNFIKKIKDYGIELIPKNGYPIRIPGYGTNNGYYSTNLRLVIKKADGSLFKKYNITECQKIDYDYEMVECDDDC